MKRVAVLLVMLLLIGGHALGQGWPPKAAEDKTVMIISHLKGKAYLRRNGTLYTIEAFDCEERAKKFQRPVRLAIADNDRFWLEKGATAQACSLTKSGALTANQTIGKGYTEKDTRYVVNYDKLTPAVYAQIRMALCSAANSKPLTDLSRAGLVLPIEKGLVRASVIPYAFWEAEGAKTVQVSVAYELNDGEIELGKWQTNGKPQGTVVMDRAVLLAKLREHFGRDDGWEDKPIPVTLRVTDSKGKHYAVTVLLADEANCKPMADKLTMLAQTLQETPGDTRDFKVSEQVAGIEEFRSEVLYLLAQAKSNATHHMLLRMVGEDASIEPKALLPPQKRD